MEESANAERLDILLVEDNPGDARLTQEALKEASVPCNLSVVEDGEKAMAFLRREGQYAGAARPDLILLDLNLPRKDGRQVLAEIHADEGLKRIPVVILTMSQAEADILDTLDLKAKSYIIKPVDVEQFGAVVSLLRSGGPGGDRANA